MAKKVARPFSVFAKCLIWLSHVNKSNLAYHKRCNIEFQNTQLDVTFCFGKDWCLNVWRESADVHFSKLFLRCSSLSSEYDFNSFLRSFFAAIHFVRHLRRWQLRRWIGKSRFRKTPRFRTPSPSNLVGPRRPERQTKRLRKFLPDSQIRKHKNRATCFKGKTPLHWFHELEILF